jgi:putative flippase GtrA
MTSPRLSAQIGALLGLDAVGLQFARFICVGLAGLTVDMLVFTGLHLLDAPPAPARAASLGVASVVTWTLNRRLTFTATGRQKRLERSRYAAVVLVSQGISYAVFLCAIAALPQIAPQAALLAGAVIATAFSFLGQRLFTFAPAPSLQDSKS